MVAPAPPKLQLQSLKKQDLTSLMYGFVSPKAKLSPRRRQLLHEFRKKDVQTRITASFDLVFRAIFYLDML